MRVTATNADGSATARSAPRRPSRPRRRATLTRQRDGVDVPGATLPPPGHRRRRQRLLSKVTATNVDGSASATAAASTRVRAPPAAAPPAVHGAARGRCSPPPRAAGTRRARRSLHLAALPATRPRSPRARRHRRHVRARGRGRRQSHRRPVIASTPAAGRRRPAALTVVSGLTLNIGADGHRRRVRRGDADGDPGRWTVPAAASTGSAATRTASRPARRWATAPQPPVDGADDGDDSRARRHRDEPGQSVTAHSAPVTVRARPVPRPIVAPVLTGVANAGSSCARAPGRGPTPRRASATSGCAARHGREIAGAATDSYLLTAADKGFTVRRRDRDQRLGSGTAPRRQRRGGRRLNTSVPVITGPSPLIQQGVTLTVGGYAWEHRATPPTALVGALRHRWLRADQRRHGDHDTLLAADVGSTIVAVSTAANAGRTASRRRSRPSAPTRSRPRWRRCDGDDPRADVGGDEQVAVARRARYGVQRPVSAPLRGVVETRCRVAPPGKPSTDSVTPCWTYRPRAGDHGTAVLTGGPATTTAPRTTAWCRTDGVRSRSRPCAR